MASRTWGRRNHRLVSNRLAHSIDSFEVPTFAPNQSWPLIHKTYFQSQQHTRKRDKTIRNGQGQDYTRQKQSTTRMTAILLRIYGDGRVSYSCYGFPILTQTHGLHSPPRPQESCLVLSNSCYVMPPKYQGAPRQPWLLLLLLLLLYALEASDRRPAYVLVCLCVSILQIAVSVPRDACPFEGLLATAGSSIVGSGSSVRSR